MPEIQPASEDSAAAMPPAETDPASLAVVHACIVHHRGQDMLDACLRTLLPSESVDLQVVILSNACQEPLPAIAAASERVHVVHSEVSIGFSEANNTAARWAKEHLGEADFYYFLNNDTESRPDTLAELVAAMRRNPGSAAAGPLTLIQAAPDHLNSLGINVTEDAWAWDEGIGQALRDYGPLPETREVAAITGSALIVDAPSFEAVEGWTEIYDWYFEDIDLCLKFWKRGQKVIHVSESVIYHRISATMTTGAERKFFFFWRNRLVLALVHWPTGLLFRVLRWALVDEILKRSRAENELQRRAFLGAMRKLPRALRLRLRYRGPDAWRRFLHPRGSVPTITLPAATENPAIVEEGGTSSETASKLEADAEPGSSEGSAEHETKLDAEGPAAKAFRVPEETWSSVAEPLPGDERLRVLVLGWGPLPFEAGRMHYAPGTRTWQMALPLALRGHRVVIAAAHIPGTVEADAPYVRELGQDGVEIFAMDRESFEAEGNLEALVSRFQPHVLVGASPVPSRRAVHLARERPVWVDLFGDPMAEAQAKASSHADGKDHLEAYWKLMVVLLQGGDRFSAVSHRQRLAVIGQLGLAGRLDEATAGEELVKVVPCAAPPSALRPTGGDARAPAVSEAASEAEDEAGGEDTTTEDNREIRLLWSGGFNTWCDAETLIEGIERAFDRHPGLRLEVTGGAIGGQDELTYARFVERVNDSRHRDRIRLHGLLPREEAEAVFARADLGIVTEKRLYERELGSSARLVGWLAAGLPFVCTDQSELASHAAENGAARIYPVGDAEALAEIVYGSSADPATLPKMAKAAREYARRHLAFEATAGPIVAWVEEKGRALPAAEAKSTEPESGDTYHGPRAFLADLDGLRTELRASRAESDALRAHLESTREQLELTQTELENTLHELEGARAGYHETRAELGRIHQSKMWKIWMGYLGLRGSLGKLLGRG